MRALTGAWPMLGSAIRPTAHKNCHASGWALHRSTTAGDGTVVCPSCSQTVPTRRDDRLGDRVRVVDDHRPT